MLLLTFASLLLLLFSVSMPNTNWRVPVGVAQALAIGAIVGLISCLVWFIWSIHLHLMAPVSYTQEMLAWPSSRDFLTRLIVLIAILIAVEWLQVRPLYQDVRGLQKAMKRYVLPRHLTEQQIATIAAYLSNNVPQKIKFCVLKGSAEVGGYREDFYNALTRGDWSVESVEYIEDLQEGVHIDFQQTQQTSRIAPDPKHPKPDELLQGALDAARIRIDGAFRTSGPVDCLMLKISRRRMDDLDVIARKQSLDMLRKMSSEPEDEN